VQDVCCVACLAVDTHKEHSGQVKSVVDVANGEKTILREHLEKIKKLETAFSTEQSQLQQALKSKFKCLLIQVSFFVMLFLDIDISEVGSGQAIDKEFDRMIVCVEARRKILKKQLQEKSKVRQ
jgi:hypothetical protein